jgi:hypothetical protein
MNDLPTFPKFEKITQFHKKIIDNFTANYEPYSDFNFTSLFSWQGDGEAEVSLLNNNLIIRVPDYLTGNIICSVLGENNIEKSLKQIITVTPELKLVPQTTVSQLNMADSPFNIIEDRDNFDYLYTVEQLVDLTGADYKKIRNKINVFLRDHKSATVRTSVTREVTEEYRKALLKVCQEWALQSNVDKDDTGAEIQALERLLNNANSLDIFIVELIINNKIKGFSINEVLLNGYGICHFEKTLKSHHANSSNYLVHEVAKILHRFGVHTVNWEQDLGIEGLRRAKMSYKPYRLLRKYTITLKNG